MASTLTAPEVEARNPQIDVRDLRVLVTAGGSGIGRAVAESFAAFGAKVHVTDLVEVDARECD